MYMYAILSAISLVTWIGLYFCWNLNKNIDRQVQYL
jgi:hypothetical protein